MGDAGGAWDRQWVLQGSSSLKHLLKSPGSLPSAGNIWKGEQSPASLSSAPLHVVKMRRLWMTHRSQEREGGGD